MVYPLYHQKDLGRTQFFCVKSHLANIPVDSPKSLILRPISVNAVTKSAVSGEATWPPSLLRMFKPSVQSAHLDWSGAIWSARDPSWVLIRENERGEATAEELGGRSPGTIFGGGAQLAVAISLMSEISIRSGRSSNPFRTGNLT